MNPGLRRTAAALAAALLFSAGCGPSGEEEDPEPGQTEVAVETGTVIRTTLNAHVSAYGSVVPAPAAAGQPGGAAYLSAPVAGLVLAVPASEGQAVQVGDLVVRLDDRMAQADFDRAQAHAHFAEQVLERERGLLEQQNTSQRSFEEAEHALALARADLANAEGALARVQLRSPLNGVVSHINVLPGQTVDLNVVVAEIVDCSRLVVSARVPGNDSVRVKIGQQAQVWTGEDREASVEATVLFVSPSVDPKTGTVLVRLDPGPDSGLRPGEFARVEITVEEHAQCLAVPRESVYITADGSGTLSVVEDATAYRKVVRVGLQDGDLIEVEGAGLEEGMTVVTVGSYALPEETAVRKKQDGIK